MRRVLHLVTRPDDAFPARLIELEKTLPDLQHEVVDLRGEVPDYRIIVEKIFASDSVQVW